MSAALRRDRTGGVAGGNQSSIVGYVPSSLSNNRDIDAILRAADEIQDEDPNIARICKLFFLLGVFPLAGLAFLFSVQ